MQYFPFDSKSLVMGGVLRSFLHSASFVSIHVIFSSQNLKNEILFVNWTIYMLNKKIKAPIKYCLDEFHFDNICKWVNRNFFLSLYHDKEKKNLRRLIQAVTTKTGKQEIVLGNKQLLKNWI